MKNLSLYHSRPTNLWDFMNEVERAFDTAWSDRTPATAEGRSMRTFNPAVDVDEADDHYLISVDLPGMKESDIKIDVHLGQLTISGERSFENKKDRNGERFYERSFGSFKRSFSLPQEVDSEKIQARFENGVLEVFVPKAEKAQARSVKIENKGGLFSRLLGDKKPEASSSEH